MCETSTTTKPEVVAQHVNEMSADPGDENHHRSSY